MNERLCPECEALGYCKFRVVAEETAQDETLTPEDKHARIAGQRTGARGRECPNLNEIDPYYPGREKI
jgi:hypothetical protein